MQEGARKDVKWCFGVLEAHFGIFKTYLDCGKYIQSMKL
jgi:hypothetical protein